MYFAKLFTGYLIIWTICTLTYLFLCDGFKNRKSYIYKICCIVITGKNVDFLFVPLSWVFKPNAYPFHLVNHSSHFQATCSQYKSPTSSQPFPSVYHIRHGLFGGRAGKIFAYQCHWGNTNPMSHFLPVFHSLGTYMPRPVARTFIWYVCTYIVQKYLSVSLGFDRGISFGHSTEFLPCFDGNPSQMFSLIPCTHICVSYMEFPKNPF